MRAVHPLRTIRASGWRSRAAAGLAVAGLLAGTSYAQPAEAHGDGAHYVILSGWISMASGAFSCPLTVIDKKMLKKSGPASVNFHDERYCGNNTTVFDFTASLRDDKYVDVAGQVRLKQKDCFIVFCDDTTRNSKDFRASIPEDWVQESSTQMMWVPNTVNSTQFNIKIIVDGPDAPAMPQS